MDRRLLPSHPKRSYQSPPAPCSQLHSSRQKQTINSLIQLFSSKLLTNVALIWRHVESGKHIWRTGHNHQHLSLLRNGNASSCSSPACLFLEGILQWMADMRILRQGLCFYNDWPGWSCLINHLFSEAHWSYSSVWTTHWLHWGCSCKAAASSSSQTASASCFCL